MASENSETGFKDLALLVPTTATALAVTYDVGYFWGLDIKTFTLFSLSEHIVFALEAVPIAILVGCYMVFLLVVVGWARLSGARKGEEIVEKFNRNEISYADILRDRTRDKWIGGAIGAVAFLLGLSTFAMGNYTIGAGTMCLSVAPLSVAMPSEVTKQSILVHSYAVVSAFLVTFATGVQVQARDVSKTTISHTIIVADTELAGLLVRSGERGLLFFQPSTKQLSFIRWDQIRRLNSLRS